MASGPIQILRANKKEAIRLSSQVGVAKMRKLLERAQTDLNERLMRAEGLGGPGADSFTATQLRVTLAQVKAVLGPLTKSMGGVVSEQGQETATAAVKGQLEYLQAAEKRFGGINEHLPLNEASMLSRAKKGVNSSVLHRLMGDPKKGPGILKRYGDVVVQRFEEALQLKFVARQPWAQVRQALVDESPFLQSMPGHWAERIVRTEIISAHNSASLEAGHEANDELGDMVKILSATFDSRTAADSYAVHGEIRRLSEPFDTWQGQVQHPPARPNDREVVVMHRISWQIPPELAWRSEGEVAARWAHEGRKTAMPGRPRMTTVPLEQFGKKSAKPQQSAALPARPAPIAAAVSRHPFAAEIARGEPHPIVSPLGGRLAWKGRLLPQKKPR